MRHVSIDCPKCEGVGQVRLTGVYLETLFAVRGYCRSNEYIVAGQAATVFGCEPTALNMRLSRLEELGLLTSERHGRERRFRPA